MRFPFWGNMFPYTKFNEINLDWILQQLGIIKDKEDKVDEAAERAEAAAQGVEEYARQAASSATSAQEEADRSTKAADRAAGYLSQAQTSAQQSDASAQGSDASAQASAASAQQAATAAEAAQTAAQTAATEAAQQAAEQAAQQVEPAVTQAVLNQISQTYKVKRVGANYTSFNLSNPAQIGTTDNYRWTGELSLVLPSWATTCLGVIGVSFSYWDSSSSSLILDPKPPASAVDLFVSGQTLFVSALHLGTAPNLSYRLRATVYLLYANI